MDKYKYQEVLCPFCKKGYTTRVFDEYDIIVKYEGNELKGWSDKCPKCDSDVFVVENEIEGKDLSVFPEDSITEFWILR